MKWDKIIIGAGIYGLYSALFCAKKGQRVLVLEYDSEPFKRATYINQARVHMGYHYPRSISTAVKSAIYFERFCNDFKFCIHSDFKQIYATSLKSSWTNAEQFEKFCEDAGIKCEKIFPEKYFNKNLCDGAFLTTEYTYDAHMLRDYFISQLQQYPNIELRFNTEITAIYKEYDCYELFLKNNPSRESSEFILNSTYASVNQILGKIQNGGGAYENFKIKYELCEIILSSVDSALKNIGLTVMDGPFFSIMPFGKTGFHSLTSVTFTPHITSYNSLPVFSCQEKSDGFCNPSQLGNCNDCPAKPQSAWPYMSHLATKYMLNKYEFKYKQSLFSMKPILRASEIDDSRPTVIRVHSYNPTFISVLSGKINTVYDLDEVLI